MGWFLYIIILIIAMVGFTIQQIPDADLTPLTTFNINETINVTVTDHPELGNIINSVTNTILEVTAAVVRWSVTVGQTYPDTSWKLIIWLVMLAILAPIVLVFIKVVALIFIFTKEIIQSRREKKLLRAYRTEKEDE